MFNVVVVIFKQFRHLFKGNYIETGSRRWLAWLHPKVHIIQMPAPLKLSNSYFIVVKSIQKAISKKGRVIVTRRYAPYYFCAMFV